MKSQLPFVTFVITFALFLFVGCTDTGSVDFKNPAIQSEIAHAQVIANAVVDAQLNKFLETNGVIDQPIQSAPVQRAISKAEVKITNAHPRISKAKAKQIATKAAEEKINQSSP